MSDAPRDTMGEPAPTSPRRISFNMESSSDSADGSCGMPGRVLRTNSQQPQSGRESVVVSRAGPPPPPPFDLSNTPALPAVPNHQAYDQNITPGGDLSGSTTVKSMNQFVRNNPPRVRHPLQPGFAPEERRLLHAPETHSVAALIHVTMSCTLVVLVIAFMALVSYVIRRMRSRAPRKALSDRVIVKRESCVRLCRRQSSNSRVITPLRTVIVMTASEQPFQMEDVKILQSYSTVGGYYARKSP